MPDPAMVLALIIMVLVVFAGVVVGFVKRRDRLPDTKGPREPKEK
jgi:hypothetical protein